MWSIDPIQTSMASLCAGVLLVVVSVPLGLAFVSYDAGGGLIKEVGLVPSLNWSIVLVFLFPGALFAALRTRRFLERTLKALPQNRMLVRRDWSQASEEDAALLVADVWRAGAPVGLFLFSIALGVGVWDYFTVVYSPLLTGELPVAPGETDFAREIDWSIAALLVDRATTDVPGVTTNLVFSTIAYVLLIGQIAYLFSFFGLLVGLAIILSGLSEGDRAVLITPDATSEDRRRGFERFTGFFMGVLAVAMLCYLACYFMRVQNLFLRTHEYGRIDQLLFNPIAASLSDKLDVPVDWESGLMTVAMTVAKLIAKALMRFLNSVFTTGDLADLQAYLGIGMILISVLLVVMALFAVLRGAAQDSRQIIEQAIADPEQATAVEAYYGLSRETIRERVKEQGMDEWPLEWPTLNTFVTYLALGLACFFFYRLALLWIALQLWQILRSWPTK